MHKTINIIYLPLESINERYTEQWSRWIPEEFLERGWLVTTILGERLSEGIEVGTFLDLYSSMHWFYTQLANTVKYLRDLPKNCEYRVDVIFIPDIEMWGVEGLRYLQRLAFRQNMYIVGFAHAGSYTKGDFMEPMEDLGRLLEPAWLNAMDLVFVGSHYHKKQIVENRLLNASLHVAKKIHVTGNPYNSDEVRRLSSTQGINFIIPTKDRVYDLIICDRPDIEKGTFNALSIAELLAEHENATIAITTSRPTYKSNDPIIEERVHSLVNSFPNVTLHEGLSKHEYYVIMANSKCYLSCTTEENFGYCCIEAMNLGTYPIVPRGYAFTQHLDIHDPFEFGEHIMYTIYEDNPQFSLLSYDEKDTLGILNIFSMLTKGASNIRLPTQSELISKASIYDGSMRRIGDHIQRLVMA
jgi:hypothetical protein